LSNEDPSSTTVDDSSPISDNLNNNNTSRIPNYTDISPHNFPVNKNNISQDNPLLIHNTIPNTSQRISSLISPKSGVVTVYNMYELRELTDKHQLTHTHNNPRKMPHRPIEETKIIRVFYDTPDEIPYIFTEGMLFRYIFFKQFLSLECKYYRYSDQKCFAFNITNKSVLLHPSYPTIYKVYNKPMNNITQIRNIQSNNISRIRYQHENSYLALKVNLCQTNCILAGLTSQDNINNRNLNSNPLNSLNACIKEDSNRKQLKLDSKGLLTNKLKNRIIEMCQIRRKKRAELKIFRVIQRTYLQAIKKALDYFREENIKLRESEGVNIKNKYPRIIKPKGNPNHKRKKKKRYHNINTQSMQNKS
jgi:hypothetical protein